MIKIKEDDSMKKRFDVKKYYVFVGLFILLNILSTYIVTTESLNHYIVSFEYTFLGIFNSFIGNLSFLLLVVFIINLFTKNMKKRIITMIVVTFLLNGFLFWINIYNRFYGTAFTFKAFQIFKNPAGNFGLTIFFEAMKEIVTYFRIILFLPFILLLTLYITSNAKVKTKNKVLTLNYKSVTSHLLVVVLLFFLNLTLFTKTTEDIIIVESLKANYATQNLGIYNYLMLDAAGFDYNIEDRNYDNIVKELDKYNKNKENYTNFIDGLNYSNKLLMKDTNNLSGDLFKDLNDEDYVNGILKDYNLVFVHLETFNYFLLEYEETNKYFYNLNALLDESYTFNNFYTNVGLGNSSDAELSVLTGLYANGTSTMFWDFNKEKEETNFKFNSIPKMFNNKGYITNSFHGNSGEFYNRENAHIDLLGFNKLHAKEELLNDSGLTLEDVKEIYDHDAGIWLTDRFTVDYFNEYNKNLNDKFMSFLITILPHTPYYYDPYNPIPKESDMYSEELIKNVDILTLKYFNYLKYYNEIIGKMIENPIENTAYIFYGDHGSQLNYNDVNYIFNNKLSSVEIKQKLLQTLAFIYVPGNIKVTKEINGNEVTINEGLFKGKQSLVRDQKDLFRTIVDLFDLDMKDNYYYGVNGISNEPSFSLDNKSLYLITDDFVGNIRNNRDLIINNQLSLERLKNIKEEVSNFKKYSDIALNNNLYKEKNTI